MWLDAVRNGGALRPLHLFGVAGLGTTDCLEIEPIVPPLIRPRDAGLAEPGEYDIRIREPALGFRHDLTAPLRLVF